MANGARIQYFPSPVMTLESDEISFVSGGPFTPQLQEKPSNNSCSWVVKIQTCYLYHETLVYQPLHHSGINLLSVVQIEI